MSPLETGSPENTERCFKVQFRHNEQLYTAVSRLTSIKVGDLVMIQAEHGLEPAKVIEIGPSITIGEPIVIKTSFSFNRRASTEDIAKFTRLLEKEQEAKDLCNQLIAKHSLQMKLIKVERFFNGSKIIFYFTAENRVDFRELVKDLVQEFRTRVEIRQVGVRHETKMIGGLGCCGRELCCSSYIHNFAPVSIKMAKEQDLPLNPTKISGICNRLLCCLTYEYDYYHGLRKVMPKTGKTITVEGQTYMVRQQNVLQETISVATMDDPTKTLILPRLKWESATAEPTVARESGKKKNKPQQAPEKKNDKKDKKQG
ncbi:MAG: hypothetical protein A2511_10755 [Deltaproteobacteria bacterium RIFOXYD12_FULL_50_9]|nr:MAG: hypothetical protein A2511_10755 [Deltaproteobacteria bacterium RIFOXYD12_FULL_50_9]